MLWWDFVSGMKVRLKMYVDLSVLLAVTVHYGLCSGMIFHSIKLSGGSLIKKLSQCVGWLGSTVLDIVALRYHTRFHNIFHVYFSLASIKMTYIYHPFSCFSHFFSTGRAVSGSE